MDDLFGSMRTYYEVWYPEDPLGCCLSDKCFMDLWVALMNRKDVYKVIGVGDSIVRERLFKKLADLLDVDYDIVYDHWVSAVGA